VSGVLSRQERTGRRPALILAALLLLAALAAGVAQASGEPASKAHSAAKGPQEAGCPMFPANNALNRDISHAPVDPHSAQYISSIGPGGHLHPSFSSTPGYGMPYLIVGPSQPKVPVRFYLSPRSSDPGPYPIPLSAPIQGERSPGSIEPGDNHVLVLQSGACKLYELYKARRAGGGWEAGSGAVFNLRSNKLRPDGWTSADAAGLPIFPLLARYPEARAGAIKHALRVTVPRTQDGYVHPATHISSSDTDPGLPPMGERLRLKASFDLSPYHGEALIVLQALKRYGLIIADEGGAWNIGGTHDAGWSDRDLKQIESVPGSAFEAVSTGPIIHSSHRGRRF
jgi:hypothetical protein